MLLVKNLKWKIERTITARTSTLAMEKSMVSKGSQKRSPKEKELGGKGCSTREEDEKPTTKSVVEKKNQQDLMVGSTPLYQGAGSDNCFTPGERGGRRTV